jgi:hypothetical protein
LNSELSNPIFIVGAPRSGTTLLSTMLNRHPAISICDETYYFYYVYSRQRAFGNLTDIENRRRLVESYLDTGRIRSMDVDRSALEQAMTSEGTDYAEMFISLMRSYARLHGKRRYGEKTPHHALHAELLRRIYPGCRLIHIVRDPRDVVASLMRMPWAASSPSANARLWSNFVQAAERCQGSENFLRVHYEHLVLDPESELQRICAFLGERFSTQMLMSQPDAKAYRWWFERAQRPVTNERIRKWDEQLSPEQVAVVERIAASPMQALGYIPEGLKASWATLASAFTQDNLYALQSHLKSIPRLWYHWLRPTQLAAEEAWIDRSN